MDDAPIFPMGEVVFLVRILDAVKLAGGARCGGVDKFEGGGGEGASAERVPGYEIKGGHDAVAKSGRAESA